MTLVSSPLSFFIHTFLFLFLHCKMIMFKYFCRKSVHSSFSKCGLGLIINETPRVSPNVIESSSVLLNVKPTTPSTPPQPEKRIGFIDDMGGGVDGLMSCTESLGSESCDERRADDDENEHVEFCEGEKERRRRKRREEKRERKKKKFPPPISSLNQSGQPSFYLKPVRKNGRLELTEVRIQRPEILQAVRENGRLRLHLVSSVVSSKINEEEVENEEAKQEEQEQLEFHLHEEEEEEEEEKKVEQVWKYEVSGECWRCDEQVLSHHHHNYHHDHHISDHHSHHSWHVWRQPCVTTR